MDYVDNLLPPKVDRKVNGPIVIVLFSLIAWIAFGAFAAFAQSSYSRSDSEASAEVEVVTAAGASVTSYGQQPGEENKTYSEVATAPSLGGLALGGGHPCAYSPATFQVSVIGSGAGVGGMKVDSACMLMVMGAAGDAKAYKAAQIMLAARDPLACFSMREAGLIAATSDCGDRRLRTAAAPATPVASSKGAASPWGAKCELVGRELRFQPSSKAARNTELQACKARFKLK